MGMRLLAVRRGLDTFTERTRDRWTDRWRRWRERARETGSLREQLSFRLERTRDSWATLRAEGGLWVRDGRPRLATHLLAAMLLVSATAAITWQVALRSTARDGHAPAPATRE